VAGVKVDFFNGETLVLRRGEERVLEEAAKRRLMVDLHGCPKPSGEERRYPNEISREGVRGLELNFMSEGPLTPSHNAALPFTRGIVGPADYTPVTFAPDHLGQTTVAQQLACAVAIISPIQVFTAFPEEILSHPMPAVTAFLKAVPAVWDESRVLPCSKIGDLAVLARRSGTAWFVAGINGGPSRHLVIPTDFLSPKKRPGILLCDGATPLGVRARKLEVNHDSRLEVDLAAGGGFVLWLPAPAQKQNK
jgi:alpha-glucosidase